MVTSGIMIQHLSVLVLTLISLKQSLTHASRLEECFDKVTRPQMNFTRISNTTVSLSQIEESSVYYLLETVSKVTWCEAYHLCQAAGCKMATVPSQRAQEAIKKVTLVSEGFAWLAARRKDFGSDWSWTIPGLPDFKDTFDGDLTGVLGTVFVQPTGFKIKGDQKPQDSKGFACFPSGDVHETKSWYLAQNECQNTSEHLGTLEEIKESHAVQEYPPGRYWLGLHMDPWIWVRGRGAYDPVLYSHWKNTTQAPNDADCLGVSLGDGWWQPKSCNHRTSYVICHDRETEQTTAVTGAAVGVPVAFICITAIVITVVIYLKRKDRLPKTWKTIFTRRARPAVGVRPPLGPYRDSESVTFSVREADAYRPQAAVQSNLTPHTFRPDAAQSNNLTPHSFRPDDHLPQAAAQSNLTPHTFRPDDHLPQAAAQSNLTPHTFRPDAAQSNNLTPHSFRPDDHLPQAAAQSNLTPHTFRPDAAQSNNMTPHSFRPDDHLPQAAAQSNNMAPHTFRPVIPCDDIYSEVRDHKEAFKESRPVQSGTSERRPKKPPRASESDSSSLAPQSPGSELYSVVRKPSYDQGSDSIDRSSVMVDNAQYGCTDDVTLSGLPETIPEYSQTLPTARPLVPQKPVQAKSQTMAKLKIRNHSPQSAMTSPSDVYAEVDKTKKKNTFPRY